MSGVGAKQRPHFRVSRPKLIDGKVTVDLELLDGVARNMMPIVDIRSGYCRPPNACDWSFRTRSSIASRLGLASSTHLASSLACSAVT